MPDENTNPAAAATPVQEPAVGAPTQSSVIVDPVVSNAPVEAQDNAVPSSDVVAEVVRKIGEAENVLVALSADPSVDEMSAAIGLSLFLDKLGKRATAIYSGATPNALEFLKPEETFEASVDTLQDFVVALNKDKADHLRYNLDGDFVKIYITPYKAKITEDDLEFSYGDFNVDLVIALDVANGIDLDSALREHGRIMHDAPIINITTGNPGKLGEIEWNDKSASSVSEMIARLLYSISGAQIEKDEATAFLTGIVAATNRFSNASTTAETMKIASRLMESGANQQLISKNITSDVENEMLNMLNTKKPEAVEDDPSKLNIEHQDEVGTKEPSETDTEVEAKESTLLDDLKEAEASLSQAGDETVPEVSAEPLKIEGEGANLEVPEGIEEEAKKIAAEEAKSAMSNNIPSNDNEKIEPVRSEKVIEPSAELSASTFTAGDSDKYGQMLENALEDLGTTANPQTTPIVSTSGNPAAVNTPSVPTTPEVNGVPEINYMPMPGDEVLPPPPTPPLDMNTPMPEVQPSVTPAAEAAPQVTPTPEPLGSQPAMQDQVYTPQAADPSAFQIPGM